jgi:nitrate reductase NapD
MCGILPCKSHLTASYPAIIRSRRASSYGKNAHMKIVSLVLKFLPNHAEAIKPLVAAVPGASVAVDSGDGRMIVVLEDGPDYAVSDSILQIHQIPQVMSTTLSYEYSDEVQALEEN